MFWLYLAAMTVAALALLLLPLWRARRGDTGRVAHDLEVYRDQLREIEKDIELGGLAADQAEAARLEVERRLLAAADSGSGRRTSARWRVPTAVGLGLALPALAAAPYLTLGSPGLPGQPFAERLPERHAAAGAEGDAGGAPDLEQMITRLAERLEREPDNLQGWRLLGRSYRAVGRYARAAEAFERATRLDVNDPELFLALGESLVMAADGVVTPRSQAALRRAHELAPKAPGARYYLGLAQFQAGRVQQAFDMWLALAADAPADAPWLPDLRRSLERAADELGVDLAAVMPAPRPPAAAEAGREEATAAPGPSREDMAAAAEMSAEERQTMIRSMVARLAERMEESPDDLEGWLRLGRAYGVLGEAAKSRQAYARAAELAPDQVPVLMAYGGAIVETTGEEAPLPEEAVRVFSRALELEPDNSQALWYVGLAEAQAGRPAEAAAVWRRLLATLDPASPEYASVEEYIEALGSD